ncbi:MAG: VanZ family protein [Acidobacteria bacterium]|nr:VanZ family protein [Acidobacteriota bacterium]
MSENVSRLPNSLPFMRKLFYWLPPFLWMAAIFIFSTDLFSAGNTGGTVTKVLRWLYPAISEEGLQTAHFLVRKAGHFTVYAVLAFLLIRAFRSGAVVRWRRQWATYSFFIVGIYALLDEYHQTFTTSRSGSIYDSMIDLTGGACMLFVLWLLSLRKPTFTKSASASQD